MPAVAVGGASIGGGGLTGNACNPPGRSNGGGGAMKFVEKPPAAMTGGASCSGAATMGGAAMPDVEAAEQPAPMGGAMLDVEAADAPIPPSSRERSRSQADAPAPPSSRERSRSQGAGASLWLFFLLFFVEGGSFSQRRMRVCRSSGNLSRQLADPAMCCQHGNSEANCRLQAGQEKNFCGADGGSMAGGGKGRALL